MDRNMGALTESEKAQIELSEKAIAENPAEFILDRSPEAMASAAASALAKSTPIKPPPGDPPPWEKTEFFCPYCGVKDVEVEPGEGDYYVGPEHRCLGCKATFHLLKIISGKISVDAG